MSARRELEQIIARLEVISHVPAVNLDPTPPETTDGKGGARPRGGIDRKDDREPDFALKSADHYRRRLRNANTERDIERALTAARATLAAWTKAPPPREPERDTYYWRLQIVNDIRTKKRTVDGCRTHYSVSRAAVYKYLRQYGDHRRLDDAA